MTDSIPRSWGELPISKPSDDDYAGAILNLPGGRVIVRSYDTTRSVFACLADDPDGWYEFDTSPIPVIDREKMPRVGDTIFYVGEVREDDRVNLWAPMRVVWVGREMDGFVSVRTLFDTSVEDSILGEGCVPLHMLDDHQRQVVVDLAESLEPADARQAHLLLAIFGCEWVLNRPQAHA